MFHPVLNIPIPTEGFILFYIYVLSTHTPYLIIIIPYFTLCCGIYQLTYWGLFDLNAFNLISIEDIIKSSVSPLLASFLASSVGLYIASLLFPKIDKITAESVESKSAQKFPWFPLALLLACVLALIIVIIKAPKDYTTYAMTTGMVLSFVINKDFVFDKSFDPKLDKRFLLMIMVYFPFISVAQALKDGDQIIENRSYQFATIVDNKQILTQPKCDTIKLIGITGDKFIFSSLDNKLILFIKSDTLRLSKK